jgi:hypothetical protein
MSVSSPTGEKETTMSTKNHSANDARSNVKNPNNPAYSADRTNRIQQGHADPPPAPPPSPSQGSAEKGNGK